jgi:pyridoxine kinase
MNSRGLRVAAIHDLSGFGRSSLTVIIPLMAKMGIQVCPLPTALLSSHGAIEGGTYLDLTDQMEPILNHWKSIDAKFNGIYSGFLGSGKQVNIVKKFIEEFKQSNTIVIVDPVMGDSGKLYSILEKDIVKNMGELVKCAGIITPNVTEAFFLLNESYKENLTREEAKDIMLRLSLLGPEVVVLTSIKTTKEEGRYTGLYSRLTGEYLFDKCRNYPVDYPGTGDGFATVFLGSLLKGYDLKSSLRNSLVFIEKALDYTYMNNIDSRDGIHLENIDLNF